MSAPPCRGSGTAVETTTSKTEHRVLRDDAAVVETAASVPRCGLRAVAETAPSTTEVQALLARLGRYTVARLTTPGAASAASTVELATLTAVFATLVGPRERPALTDVSEAHCALSEAHSAAVSVLSRALLTLVRRRTRERSSPSPAK